MTKVVTFYSYKGGVGRTMALVNVAHVLARDGWRVLMVDFDLEAPGMTHFFAKQVRDRPKSVTHDALDLLLHAKSAIGWDPVEKKPKPLEIPKSLAQYVVNIRLPEEWKDKVIPYRTGRLDLLPATLDPVEPEEAPEAEPSRSYLQRMDELDLQGVFDTGGPRHWFGNHVRQYFVNARFEATGDTLFTLRDKVWAAYDLVLVDSRTGLNEVAGLCIGPLCDALVICCGLNDQSIYGTRYFMKKAGLFDRGKAKRYTLVAGPVPPWHTREADERIAILRRELRADEVVGIPYHPAAALVEKRFVLDEPKEPITSAYETLAPVVARLAKAPEEADGEHWAIDLIMRARHEEGGWSELARKVPQRLGACRLREPTRALWRVGVLASFPTAATMAALASRAEWRDPRDWAQMPFAAAVSAQRLLSDRPFRRAWKLLAPVSDEEERERLGVRLLFMQLRVLGTVPDREVGYPALHSAADRVKKEVKSGYFSDKRARALLDVWMTMHLFRSRETPWRVHGVGEKTLEKWASKVRDKGERVVEQLFRHHGHWYGMIEEPPASRWAEHVLDSTAELMGRAQGPAHGSALQKLVDRTRLPMPFTKMADEPSHMWLRMLSRGMMHPMMFEEMREGRAWFDMPLGFWPEPLMASAVAVVKGPEGVKEVLGWLMMARLTYGYAWRVLVDWRHLEPVKDHPAFVEFIRAEDEMVEEIESAIDRGEYPL